MRLLQRPFVRDGAFGQEVLAKPGCKAPDVLDLLLQQRYKPPVDFMLVVMGMLGHGSIIPGV